MIQTRILSVRWFTQSAASRVTRSIGPRAEGGWQPVSLRVFISSPHRTAASFAASGRGPNGADGHETPQPIDLVAIEVFHHVPGLPEEGLAFSGRVDPLVGAAQESQDTVADAARQEVVAPVCDDELATRTQDARNLPEGPVGIRPEVKGAGRNDDVERALSERKSMDIRLHQTRRRCEAGLSDSEHLAGHIDTDRPQAWSLATHLAEQGSRATADVEETNSGVQVQARPGLPNGRLDIVLPTCLVAPSQSIELLRDWLYAHGRLGVGKAIFRLTVRAPQTSLRPGPTAAHEADDR